MTNMLKNLGKSFRKSYNYIKYVVFLGKKDEDVISKSGLVCVKINEKDGSTSYELAVMKMEHFGLEIYFHTIDSKRKISENQKDVKSFYIEKWLPVKSVIQTINQKYEKEMINTFYNGLDENEITIIKKELPNIMK